MRERGHRRVERAIQQDLLRRVRDVIVAADHVRDSHLDIVAHHRQLIGGLAVGAKQDEILDVRAVELDRPVNEIVEAGDAFRHAEADGARLPGAIVRRDLRRATDVRRSGRSATRRLPARRPRASPSAPRSCSSSSTRGRPRRAAAAAARCRSIRCDWKYGPTGPSTSGPSSQSRPSQRRPSRMPSTISVDDRSASVSSMRRTNVPPCRRANSQLKSAVRAPPTCRYPVGDGANRTRTIPLL